MNRSRQPDLPGLADKNATELTVMGVALPQTLTWLKAQGRRVLRMDVSGASYRLTVEDTFRWDGPGWQQK